MRDLQHQLRDYWARIAAGLPVPTAEQALTARVGEGAVRPLVDRPGPRPRPAWVAAGRALFSRRRGEMTATYTAPQTAPLWRRPAVVISAAFVVTLAAVGTTLLLTRRGEEPAPVTTLPPTTTLPVTTTPAPTTTGGTISVEAWSYPAEAVPPFHATILWDRNPESTWGIGYQGSTALIEVWYEAPRRFRFQLVELDTDLVAEGVPGAGRHLGGPGSYLVGDGEAMGHYSFADDTWGETEAYHYLAFMFWEPESSGRPFDWAGECAQHSALLGAEQVAGRAARRINCSTVRGDWELWVDAVTGLVLRMRGETEIDDSLLGTSPAGGFEVTAIEFLEAPIPGADTLFAVIAPEGAELPASIDVSAVPPLHAVIAFEAAPPDLGEEGPQLNSHTEEIWYQDPQNWRAEVVEVAGPAEWAAGAIARPGEVRIMAAGTYTAFYPMTLDGYENAYWVTEEGYDGKAVDQLVPGERTTGRGQAGIETVAGRPATHWVRRDAIEGGSSTTHVWIDILTGLKLKSASETVVGDAVSRGSQTVLSIEFGPDFAEGIFTFTPEPGWCNLTDTTGCFRSAWDGTNLEQGEEVPTFSGPLADGTQFDLADLRGRPAIVFLWWDAFEPGVLDQLLADFEALYEEWGDRVAFVSVPDMWESDLHRFVERVPLTHLVVNCFADPDPAHQASNELCTPYPTDLWSMAWPSWLMIDADGQAVALLKGSDTTYEALDAMIAAAAGG